ncbi:hypothetical protein HDV06_005861 [Boothiomyces sp. JEL0866]|nr:hypothetical protein HDV06_005861 [Boothiomyces sp. JEL0866]
MAPVKVKKIEKKEVTVFDHAFRIVVDSTAVLIILSTLIFLTFGNHTTKPTNIEITPDKSLGKSSEWTFWRVAQQDSKISIETNIINAESTGKLATDKQLPDHSVIKATESVVYDQVETQGKINESSTLPKVNTEKVGLKALDNTAQTNQMKTETSGDVVGKQDLHPKGSNGILSYLYSMWTRPSNQQRNHYKEDKAHSKSSERSRSDPENSIPNTETIEELSRPNGKDETTTIKEEKNSWGSIIWNYIVSSSSNVGNDISKPQANTKKDLTDKIKTERQIEPIDEKDTPKVSEINLIFNSEPPLLTSNSEITVESNKNEDAVPISENLVPGKFKNMGKITTAEKKLLEILWYSLAGKVHPKANAFTDDVYTLLESYVHNHQNSEEIIHEITQIILKYQTDKNNYREGSSANDKEVVHTIAEKESAQSLNTAESHVYSLPLINSIKDLKYIVKKTGYDHQSITDLRSEQVKNTDSINTKSQIIDKVREVLKRYPSSNLEKELEIKKRHKEKVSKASSVPKDIEISEEHSALKDQMTTESENDLKAKESIHSDNQKQTHSTKLSAHEKNSNILESVFKVLVNANNENQNIQQKAEDSNNIASNPGISLFQTNDFYAFVLNMMNSDKLPEINFKEFPFAEKETSLTKENSNLAHEIDVTVPENENSQSIRKIILKLLEEHNQPKPEPPSTFAEKDAGSNPKVFPKIENIQVLRNYLLQRKTKAEATQPDTEHLHAESKLEAEQKQEQTGNQIIYSTDDSQTKVINVKIIKEEEKVNKMNDSINDSEINDPIKVNESGHPSAAFSNKQEILERVKRILEKDRHYSAASISDKVANTMKNSPIDDQSNPLNFWTINETRDSRKTTLSYFLNSMTGTNSCDNASYWSIFTNILNSDVDPVDTSESELKVLNSVSTPEYESDGASNMAILNSEKEIKNKDAKVSGMKEEDNSVKDDDYSVHQGVPVGEKVEHQTKVTRATRAKYQNEIIEKVSKLLDKQKGNIRVNQSTTNEEKQKAITAITDLLQDYSNLNFSFLSGISNLEKASDINLD